MFEGVDERVEGEGMGAILEGVGAGWVGGGWGKERVLKGGGGGAEKRPRWRYFLVLLHAAVLMKGSVDMMTKGALVVRTPCVYL